MLIVIDLGNLLQKFDLVGHFNLCSLNEQNWLNFIRQSEELQLLVPDSVGEALFPQGFIFLVKVFYQGNFGLIYKIGECFFHNMSRSMVCQPIRNWKLPAFLDVCFIGILGFVWQFDMHVE